MTAQCDRGAEAPIHFDAAALAALLPFAPLLDHMAAALAQPVTAPLRMNVPGEQQRELLIMPVLSSRLAGVKLLTVVPDNGTRGLPAIGGLFVLFDMADGRLLATMEASELTGRRTAAVSALAAERLARPDANRLLLVGAGHLVRYLAEAHAAVRPIERIAIWARDTAKAARAVRLVQAHLPHCLVSAADSLEAAVAEADIVSCATRATEPLLRGSWLRPGQHVDLVGGYRPDMREIDDEGIVRSAIYVDSREAALTEAGDLASPIARGIIAPDAIRGDLPALLTAPPPTALPARLTLFKAVGTAAADLAAAEMAWRSRPS